MILWGSVGIRIFGRGLGGQQIGEEVGLADPCKLSEEVAQKIVIRLSIGFVGLSETRLHSVLVGSNLFVQIDLSLLQVFSEALQGRLVPPALKHPID